jgi:hypothetical protein
MPRKQRFKPSRKPKPMEAPLSEPQSSVPSETGQIEQGTPPRTGDGNGVIQASGDHA